MYHIVVEFIDISFAIKYPKNNISIMGISKIILKSH